MDTLFELAQLNQYMQVEAEGDTPPAPDGAHPLCPDDLPIGHATLPNGKRIAVLKTLLSSACERNCNYCAFRAGRDFRRRTFAPDDLARAFMQLHQKGTVQGIFLSSGVAGGSVRTQDKLIDTAEILRQKLGYTGYLHLKMMPGSEKDQVLRAMQLASRVSVNLEAPTTQRLAELAPQKHMLEELLQPLRWVEEIRQTQSGVRGWNGHWPSSVTQFVTGGAGESDLELLNASQYLHHRLRLARVYFSPFSPVPDTPLEHHPAVNPWRVHRLYQADFLLRDYGFSVEDFPFAGSGELPLETDPKLAWARQHLAEAPVELNLADRPQLLRVPGIGPHGATAILAARRQNHLRSLEDLKTLGVVAQRAAPFILLDGRRAPVQLRLW